MNAIRVSEDERANLLCGVAFYAVHWREQLRGARGADRKRIIARLTELSRLSRKVGGRDWIAEGDKP
jgi:hypothetical protein